MTREEAIDVLKHNYPSVCFTELCEAVEIAIQALSAQPERMKGHWTEKEVVYIKDVKDAIDAWQSCKCSECGRYDTRPYMYFFSDPRFCSYCGAEMKGEDDAEVH